MTITFFLSLVEDYRVVRPILVVVPKSLIQNWEHELYQWAPKLYIVNYASKTEEARGIIRRTEFSSFSEPFKPQIVLTTFEIINCVRPSNELSSYLVYHALVKMVAETLSCFQPRDQSKN
jgi:SNF2 family DNA or RNA helicase